MADRYIAWDMLSDDLAQSSLANLPLGKLGVELQKLYYQVALESEETSDEEELLSSVIEAVEDAGEAEAEWLSKMYQEGTLPRASRAAKVAALFISRIGQRFRRALCLELRENRDVALSARETLVVLAPTIVAIMELRAEYAALAVPLSIVLTKISLNAFCEGVVEGVEQEAFMQERVNLARKAVLYLQHEMSRYKEAIPPPLLQEALKQAELRLRELEARTGLAGLILLDARKDVAISEKVMAGRPEAVIESMREGIRQVNALEWDVFISYASEDREEFVRPLAEHLRGQGLRVWYADFVLKVGDSLNRSIDAGLARSKFGIVVISPSFLAKEWPRRELDGLVTREVDGTKVILPVWHNIEYEQLRVRSPLLADRIAVKSADGLDRVVDRLLEVLRPSSCPPQASS